MFADPSMWSMTVCLLGECIIFCETEDRLLFLKPFEMSFSRCFWQHLYIAWNVLIYTATLSTNLVIICAGSPSMLCGGYCKEEIHFKHTGYVNLSCLQ